MIRRLAILALCASACFAVTVRHSNGTTTAWSPDGWGDCSSSTSTGGYCGALENAVGGDTIVLTHGVTYQQPTISSTVTVPNASGTLPITLTGDDNAALPPSGQRVCTGACTTPPSSLPLIQAAVNFSAALLTPACASHDFNVQGVAFGVASGGSDVTYSDLVLGEPFDGSVTPQCMSRRYTFDRVWAAGNYNQPGPCRVFAIDIADSVIENSYVDEAGEYGQDCQGVYTTASSNLLLKNNWIGGVTENFMCGGAGSSINGYLCNNITMIGNIFPKHIQWRMYASNTTPALGDARSACVYYPPDLNYDGIGGGEVWVNGTNSCTANGAFPPSGSGDTSSSTTTGAWWECNSSGTWAAQTGSKTFSCKYATAIQLGGQQGTVKNNSEFKNGYDEWLWGNVYQNTWASGQDELFMLNGPNTENPPELQNTTRGTHGVTLEYSILRDAIGGLAAGSGFSGIASDPFHAIRESNLLLDNVASPNRNCVSCAYNSVPSQAVGGSLLSSSPTYNTYVSNAPVATAGGWVVRHVTAVNSAVGGAMLYYNTDPQTPVTNGLLGTNILDNVFQLGGGISGGCGPTLAQVFNYGGAYLYGYPGPGTPYCATNVVWSPGSTFHHNIISEDISLGGFAFTHSGGSTPSGGKDGPAFNGVSQGTTLYPAGASTSSCCFNNYLPAVQPTIASAGTGATWDSGTWAWTYPNYNLSASGTACNPDGSNPTTGAPTGTCTGVASDGTNPGADLATVYGFTAYSISGLRNPNLDFRVNPVVTLSGTSAALGFQAPLGATSCTVTVSANESMSPTIGSHSIAGSAPEFLDTITGLSGTYFWATVACPDQVNGGATLTRKFSFQI